VGCPWACALGSNPVNTIGPFSVQSAIARAAFLGLFTIATVAAQAQTIGKKQSTNPAAPVPLARYVPASAELFVDFLRPGDVDEVFRRAQVGRLWSMAAGRSENPDRPFDLRNELHDFLGLESAVKVDELLKTEIGVMTPSWSDLDSAVWFVRLPKPGPLDRWFPRDRRQESRGPVSERLIRMNDGMIVGIRDGIISMARRGDDMTLAREALRQMVSGVGESLQDSAAFKELASYLPAEPLAVAHWSKGAIDTDAAINWAPPLPRMERAVVGMFDADGRIDFAVRAALSAPHSRKTLAGHTVNKLMKLPATTLVACATTIGFDDSPESAAGANSMAWWARAHAFLSGLQSANGDAAQPSPLFGPHFILAWDQDLSAAGTSPQLALIVETRNARLLKARFEAIIDPYIGQGSQDESADVSQSEPAISRRTHFGVSIAQATLYPEFDGLPLPLAHWVEELPLSWAAQGEWFIIALSRGHIARILDAQFGLVPVLSSVADVQALRKRRASHTTIVLMQPDLASDVLQRWVSEKQAPHPIKLDPSLMTEPSLAEAVQRARLGIGMHLEPEPGTVVVARVYPGTPAEGHLLPEDRIIGIDGQLLDMETPNADLRRRWAGPSDLHGHTLRIQRNDTTIELFLEHEDPDPRRKDMLARSIPAIRGLASALRAIPFASLTVHPTDERHLSVLVSLRLAQSPTSASR